MKRVTNFRIDLTLIEQTGAVWEGHAEGLRSGDVLFPGSGDLYIGVCVYLYFTRKKFFK